jgi:trk system potassium uptake protein
MLALLVRRSLFLVLATSILQFEAIQFAYKSLVIDALVALTLLALLKSFGGVSLNLILRLFSERKFQRNIIGLTSNWLFSRGFINILAAAFLSLSLIHWFELIPFFSLDLNFGAQNEVFRNAGLLVAYIGFFLDSPLTFAWLRKLDLTPSRLIFFSYGMATLVGTLLLIMPISLRENTSLSLVDSMFTTVSALAVTGLNTVPFDSTFSIFGQSIVLILIQLGGLGILALSVAFVAIAGQKLSIHHTLMGSELYNTKQLGGLQSYLGKITIATLLIESLGAVYIYLTLPAGIENRFFVSIFHAVSGFCNAGFSTFSNSLDLEGLNAMRMGICTLVILGGLGFPVFFELMNFLKPSRVYKRLSGHTWLVLITSSVLLALGTILIAISELTHNTKMTGSTLSVIGESFFYSVSSRSAGFNVTSVSDLSFVSQVLLACLMLVGGSPMSTAGGIKTTTIGVIVASAWSSLKGRSWIQFKKSTIPQATLQKAVTIVILYIGILIGSVILLTIVEQKRVWPILFEAISALSTVGLSTGITSELSNPGKYIIIFLMLAGRVGLVSLAYLGLGRTSEQKHQYAKDNYYVG